MATVLIVDDSTDMANLMARMIRSWNHESLTAPSGEAGLALLVTHKVDLIIVDGMMPGMNGTEFIRLLRANADTAMIPAVLFTALHDNLFFQNAIEKGANECWLKGDLDYDQMKERVEFLLAQHRPG